MTNAQKLEALVRKAIENGWPVPWMDFNLPKYDDYGVEDSGDRWPYPAILFNHDFARALFGEEEMFFGVMELGSEETEIVARIFRQPRWFTLEDVKKHRPVREVFYTRMPMCDYHLQQAVISKNPIDYMYKAVFDDQ